MLFAMTSTQCAGRVLPLPVYLKIHLVAGQVYDEPRESRGLNVRWLELCICVFANSIKALHMVRSDRKSSCDHCECVCGRDRDRDPQLHDCVYYVEKPFTLCPLPSE